MGSRRKRRKLATVHMDRLDFKGVSGTTIDEDKPCDSMDGKRSFVLEIRSVFKREEKEKPLN